MKERLQKRGQEKMAEMAGMMRRGIRRIAESGCRQEPGIDGILVTVGLCVIALLLCVVMKDSLKVFIETIVEAMTTEAQNILTGVTP